MTEIKNIKELTEALRKYNTALDDSVIVYCEGNSDKIGEESF